MASVEIDDSYKIIIYFSSQKLQSSLQKSVAYYNRLFGNESLLAKSTGLLLLFDNLWRETVIAVMKWCFASLKAEVVAKPWIHKALIKKLALIFP